MPEILTFANNDHVNVGGAVRLTCKGVCVAGRRHPIVAASHANDIHAVLPPQVEYLAIPARGLALGMSADQLHQAMGAPARVLTSNPEGAERLELEFAGAIPAKVIVADGRVSKISLDVFRPDKSDIPAFGRPAWPGLADNAVRVVLGEPAEVRHHTPFGINVDQWVFARAGQPDLSLFFRTARNRPVGGA